MTQSITTLISKEYALRLAREAVDATVSANYPSDGKVYVQYLDMHLREKFAEAPTESGEFLPPQPELDFCSRCHEHTIFTLNDGRLVSDCCGAGPVEVDPS